MCSENLISNFSSTGGILDIMAHKYKKKGILGLYVGFLPTFIGAMVSYGDLSDRRCDWMVNWIVGVGEHGVVFLGFSIFPRTVSDWWTHNAYQLDSRFHHWCSIQLHHFTISNTTNCVCILIEGRYARWWWTRFGCWRSGWSPKRTCPWCNSSTISSTTKDSRHFGK